MSALAIAMILTGAGGLGEAQGSGMPPPAPYVVPPAPYMVPPPPSQPQGQRPRLLQDSYVDYFTPADYPPGALPAGGHAYVGFSVMVAPDGRVTTCMVTMPSGSPALDLATCLVIRERARYRPALDEAGQPAVGRHGGGIMWQAPAAPGEPARVMIPSPPAPRILPPQRARANLNSYFSMDDYPAAAIQARHEGTTGFALTIGPNGRASDCTITVSSGSGPLDAATCRILRSRSRYTPARDAGGTPTTGRDSGRVTWRLPDNNADRAGIAMAYTPVHALTPDANRVTATDLPPGVPPPGPMTESDLRVAVGRDGQVIGCDIEESSGSQALDAAACRIFSARARFTPGHDPAGAAVCDVTWETVDWTPAGAGATPLPPRARTRAPAARPPRPLREQLSARLCPGWPVAGRPVPSVPPLLPPGTPGAYSYPIIRPTPPAPPAPPFYGPRARPPQRARVNLNSYFSIDDYPAAALRAREQGTAGLSLTIDPNGRVSGCTVTESSGSAALDAAACRILRSRARYTPGRNADGEAVSGRDYGRITWRLPEG